jgi:hypothetical protein
MVNKAIVGDAAVIPVAGLAYVYSYVNGVWVVVEPGRAESSASSGRRGIG